MCVQACIRGVHDLHGFFGLLDLKEQVAALLDIFGFKARCQENEARMKTATEL